MRDKERMNMVQEQIINRGIINTKVISALQKVIRHDFIPVQNRIHAYEDRPLAIGLGQTISQPYIVALMTEALDIQEDDKILEIGTGSGYQTAVLLEMGAQVFTVERIPEISNSAKKNLSLTEYSGVHYKLDDGYHGWAENAPYDFIILTCAADVFPTQLWDQLKEGGKMVLPLEKKGVQRLQCYTKNGDLKTVRDLCFVRFVPMVHVENNS